MTHNDVLRRLRYALDLDDAGVHRLVGLGGREVSPATVSAWLARDDEPGFVECPDAALAAFLDGLVTERRGARDPAAPPRPKDGPLDNNLILKKLRVALELKEEGMLELLALGGQSLSASELGALFRKPDHKHYRACGDQVLRKFLQGLATKLRG